MINMNEECKYCSYLKQCPDVVEHNSIYCKCHKRIPKDRNMSYEQLQNNWNELKNWCKENQYNDDFDSYQVDNYTTYGVILKKMQELESGNNDI